MILVKQKKCGQKYQGRKSDVFISKTDLKLATPKQFSQSTIHNCTFQSLIYHTLKTTKTIHKRKPKKQVPEKPLWSNNFKNQRILNTTLSSLWFPIFFNNEYERIFLHVSHRTLHPVTRDVTILETIYHPYYPFSCRNVKKLESSEFYILGWSLHEKTAKI